MDRFLEQSSSQAALALHLDTAHAATNVAPAPFAESCAALGHMLPQALTTMPQVDPASPADIAQAVVTLLTLHGH